MAKLTRRDFLKISGMLAGAAGLAAADTEVIARGLSNLAEGKTRVLWMEGQSCSGCSVSLLNTESPKPLELLTQYVDMIFQPVIGSAQGSVALDVFDKAAEVGNVILIFEGSIPMGMPKASILGGKPLEERLLPLVKQAPFIIAAGTCSSFGGIPAAEGNPTGAASMREFMEAHGISPEGKLINCPSCPVHPLSLVGTIAQAAAGHYPEVVEGLYTPVQYYGKSTHDSCPRFHDYSKHIFAEKLGDQSGCLFKLGCLGPLSYTQCPDRQWNGGVNWCVKANAPCIACSSPLFARYKSFPFYRNNEHRLHELELMSSGQGETS